MDQAVADGVHVISLSVGASGYAPQYDHDSIAIGAFGAAQHGVVVSCSAENGGSKYPLVYADDCGSRYCHTQKLDPSKVTGKIVICDRGGNARADKGNAVKIDGGVGMIHANTDDNGEELLADSHLIPATMVGAKAGDKVREYASSDSSPTATITFEGTVIGRSPSAPRVASFSSRVPNHLTAEILKPDLIGPGVNILAGWTGYTSQTCLDLEPIL